MLTLLCTSARCRTEPDTGEPDPAQAAPGLRLCWICRDRLAARLGDLPDLDKALLPMLTNTGSSTGERVSGNTPSHGLTLNPAVTEARADLRAVLAAWADLVTDERGIAAPIRAVPELAAFLHRHVGWLAAHPAAGDCAEEIGDLVHAARRAAYPHTTRRIRIAACPAADCGGELVAALREADAPRASAIDCTDNAAHTWTAQQWPALRRQLRGRAGAPRSGGGHRT